MSERMKVSTLQPVIAAVCTFRPVGTWGLKSLYVELKLGLQSLYRGTCYLILLRALEFASEA